MKCRVIFPAVRAFPNLRRFCGYAKELLGEIREKDGTQGDTYAANFFLFGEDMLGESVKKEMFSEAGRIVEQKEVRSFISSLQKSMSDRDFVIFSLYSHVGYNVLNAAYLVCRNKWYFDFKRKPVDGDKELLGGLNELLWGEISKKSPKSAKRVEAGGVCIDNLHLFVCADVRLLSGGRLGKNPIVFIPACGLHSGFVKDAVSGLNGNGGYAFINDPRKRLAYIINLCDKSERKEPKATYFGGKAYLCSDFELKQ